LAIPGVEKIELVMSNNSIFFLLWRAEYALSVFGPEGKPLSTLKDNKIGIPVQT
jgi:hypothetical protein